MQVRHADKVIRGSKMKKLFLLLLVLPLLAMAGEVTVTSVTAQQRYPWNGLVDVIVTIQGSAEDMAVTECSFVATNGATKAAILVAHVTRPFRRK